MDASKVDTFILTNSKYFESYQLASLREKLLALPEEKWAGLLFLQFKDPTIALIISLLVGGLGIDRFYIGDTGLGIVKLLTCGGLSIWTIIDWFLIMGATKEKNFQKLQESLYL
jgi:TM2 domain-containing membrane protein YozV